MSACPEKNSGNTGSGKKATAAAKDGAERTASTETEIKVWDETLRRQMPDQRETVTGQVLGTCWKDMQKLNQVSQFCFEDQAAVGTLSLRMYSLGSLTFETQL